MRDDKKYELEARKAKGDKKFDNKQIIELKPTDIERVSVCDFGLATKTHDKIPKGGTPAFLSPLSFCREFKVSQDRFSLAIMCLQVLWEGRLEQIEIRNFLIFKGVVTRSP